MRYLSLSLSPSAVKDVFLVSRWSSFYKDVHFWSIPTISETRQPGEALREDADHRDTREVPDYISG